MLDKVITVTDTRKFLFHGGRNLLTSCQDELGLRASLSVVTVGNFYPSSVNSVLLPWRISLPWGSVCLRRGILSLQNKQMTYRLWEISHPLQELWWERPCTMDTGMSRMHLSIG